jgi:4-hydroxy-tetrahydrodipicolinate synthase
VTADKEPRVMAESRDAAVFRGAGVALLTMFDRDGTLLLDETAAFARTLAERGAAALLVAGTTGEFWTLSTDERLSLITAVRAAVDPDVPVIAGIGALDATQTLELAAAAEQTGADAALCLVPRDVDPQVLLHKVRDLVGDLPLLGYHFPAAGYAPLPVEDLAALPIDGLKDSSGDAQRLLATATSHRAGIYTGSALLCSLGAALQIDGAILALGNAAPELGREAFEGSLEAQRKLARLSATIGGGTPPTALKAYVAERRATPPWTRGVALHDVLRTTGGPF